MRPLLVVALLIVVSLCAVQAQGERNRIVVGFYNVENLYDTIPSPFYDDSDYTPSGRLRWDTEKYRRKIENIARVIGELSPSVIGLAEVESETAVRDLVGALPDDYNYIHRTGGDGRGMDLVLLYRGDQFVPLSVRLQRSGATREFLHVRGELMGEAVDVVVCHLPSRLNDAQYRDNALRNLHAFADSLHRVRSDPRLIIMGDFNAAPSDKQMRAVFGTGRRLRDPANPLFFPLERAASRGAGSYAYNNRWYMFDQIILSAGFLSGQLRYAQCGTFVREYMLEHDSRFRYAYPLRTFSSGVYRGGFSDHLPVWAAFDVIGSTGR